MYSNNFGDALTQIAIAAVATVNSTTNTTGVDLTGTPSTSTGSNSGSVNYEGQLVLLLDANNTAGSTPTLDIKLQHSDSSGSGYTDVTGAAFTQLTTTASQQKIVVNKDQLKRYVRLAYTIGGTSSPAYSVSVQGVLCKKYPA